MVLLVVLRQLFSLMDGDWYREHFVQAKSHDKSSGRIVNWIHMVFVAILQ
jgi:hypothetical protein